MSSDKLEKTFVLIKPDGVRPTIFPHIITRLYDAGLDLAASYMVNVDREFAAKHYAHVLKLVPDDIGNNILNYITSGNVIPSVWVGENAIETARQTGGNNYDPENCKVGTIRKDLIGIILTPEELADKETRSIRNVIHTSDSPTSAKKELDLWFKGYQIDNILKDDYLKPLLK